MTAPTTQAEQEDAVRERYTVVYEGDSTGVKILSGEPAAGRAVTVMAGDLWEEARTLRAERDSHVASLAAAVVQISDLAQAKGEAEAQRDQLAADLRKAREALQAMLIHYGPPEPLRWSLEYPAGHPISLARAVFASEETAALKNITARAP